MKTIVEKLKEYLAQKMIPISLAEKKIGLSNGSLSKPFNTGTTIKTDTLEKFLNHFSDINPDWLLKGKGQMLKEPNEENEQATKKSSQLIPLYDGVMTASKTIQDLVPQSGPVEMVDAGDWFRDATTAMRIHGDSMYPDYVSGSIVVMKEVNNKRLIVYGEDYLIETSEYRVLKRLQKSDLKHCWLACSVNQEVWEMGQLKGRLVHEPFDVHIDDVLRLYKVLGSVKRNHSSRIVKI